VTKAKHYVKPREGQWTTVRRRGAQFERLPVAAGHTVPRRAFFHAERRPPSCMVLRRGHTLESRGLRTGRLIGRASAGPVLVRRAQCWFLDSHRHAGRKAYPACSMEPLEIWLTHVQRAFREKAVSRLRPDCQHCGRGELLRGTAAHSSLSRRSGRRSLGARLGLPLRHALLLAARLLHRRIHWGHVGRVGCR